MIRHFNFRNRSIRVIALIIITLLILMVIKFGLKEESKQETIHLFQVLISSKSTRFHILFLKSLLWHHFEKGGANAAPIHLHLLADKATTYSLHGILGSWRINNLHYKFYPAEPYQGKATSMRSYHHATNITQLKMFAVDILESSIPKVIVIDSDTLFLTDVAHLWSHFKHFSRRQFVAMVQESQPGGLDLSKFGGRRGLNAFNGGLVLMYLERVNSEKWKSLWEPALQRLMKQHGHLLAAEQTLMTATIMDNPTIFYLLPCTWNYQMYSGVRVELCPTTWTTAQDGNVPEPLLLHPNRGDKQESRFSLKFPDKLAADESKLCRSNISDALYACKNLTAFTFTTNHRIHPIFMSKSNSLILNISQEIGLALSLQMKDIDLLPTLFSQWKGWISVSFHGSDLEALHLLGFVEKLDEYKKRQNIFIHYVYQNTSFPESTTLHNTAVVYTPTTGILLLSENKLNLTALEMVKSLTEGPIIISNNINSQCNGTIDNLCVSKYDLPNEIDKKHAENILGLVISTSNALLPSQLDTVDRKIQLQALLTNYLL